MFERYTEKARRAVFFARYEASQFGSRTIAPEHLLLGLLREDKSLIARFFPLNNHLTLDSVRREVETRSILREKIPQSAELVLSPETKRVLGFANDECDRLQSRTVGTEHLLLAILREERSMAAEILYERGLRLHNLRDEVLRQNGTEKAVTKETPHLTEFARDLTEAAFKNRLDPLIGREPEIERVVQILCRKTKNNPILIGEPGVGKTAIVEGLAQKIISGEVPTFLEHKRVLALDLSLIVAGTKYRGQFEERLKNIMRELRENPQYIVFIDEIHTLIGAGSAEGALDAANILKPALSRGEIQCIGATTPREFKKSIERDRALERRFQQVKVEAPSELETLLILEGVREHFEKFHQVYYTPQAIETAVKQSNRYITDRFLPDKAIDVLDEAGARVKLRAARHKLDDAEIDFSWQRTVKAFRRDSDGADEKNFARQLHNISVETLDVTKDDVEEVIANWTGIPVAAVKETESQKLLRIEEELKKRIISQSEAVSALARAIRRSRAGLKSAKRPVGSFLFLGATGVGKTEVARTLAEFLFGSENAMIRLDMSEFMEKHSVAKLIGSPPGYVGHEEGGQLTEKLRRQPYSVVLLDEVEKAHPELFNILLQVFEDGAITDAQGTTVDCRNAIFILTSNIGARFLQGKGNLGFQANATASREKTEDAVKSAVKQTFTPEFINRLDEIIIFEELTEDDLLKIVDLQVNQLNEGIIERGLEVYLTDEAKRWLVRKTCGDRAYGARPLRRALQRYVEDQLSDALIRGELESASRVEIFVGSDSLEHRVTKLKPVEELLLAN